MLNYAKGNVLKMLQNQEVSAVLHCANCRGVMGSGIALQIKNNFNQAYLEYKKHEKENGLKLGTVSKAETSVGTIFNLHAQKDYGVGKRQVNYEALYRCLEDVKETLTEANFTGIVGVPYRMASDRAGGDWSIVEAMLKSALGEFNILIVKYNE